MGNQLEKAFNAAEKALEDSGNPDFSERLDEIEKKIDNVTNNSDNNTQAAEDAEGQEEPPASSIAELRGLIDDQAATIERQNETIERLTGIMGKMVTRFGAQVSDSDDSPNTDLGDETFKDGTDEVPLLSDLKLG